MRRKKATCTLFQTGPTCSLTEARMSDGNTSSAPADVVAAVDTHFTALQTPDEEVDIPHPRAVGAGGTTSQGHTRPTAARSDDGAPLGPNH